MVRDHPYIMIAKGLVGWVQRMAVFADDHFCIYADIVFGWCRKGQKNVLTHYIYGSFWNFNNCGSLSVRFIIVALCPPPPGIFSHRPYFVTRWYLRSLKILMRLDPHNDGMFICFGIFSNLPSGCIIYLSAKKTSMFRKQDIMCPSYAGTVIKQASKSRLVNKQSNNSLRLLNSKAENV